MEKYFSDKDIELLKKLELNEIAKLDFNAIEQDSNVKAYEVSYPHEGYKFLHEAAIIEYKNVLHASWYNCPEKELKGYTPIRESISIDGGKTWSSPKTVCEDKDEKIMYCPPVYYKDGNMLYMLVNSMVAPDYMHSIDLYAYNENSDTYDFIWSRNIPFKLNTNVYKMNNGKLLIPGRIATEVDGFPRIPAVIIVDSGDITSDYRIVKIQDGEYLPENIRHQYPEISAIINDSEITIFCRNDESKVPIMYISNDYGEHWSEPMTHNIPFSNSKIYSGTLSNKRNYVVGNLLPDRKLLAIFFTEPNEKLFTKGVILQNGYSKELGYGDEQWSYPSAYEWNDKLYIIYTVIIDGSRGAVVSVVPINI